MATLPGMRLQIAPLARPRPRSGGVQSVFQPRASSGQVSLPPQQTPHGRSHAIPDSAEQLKIRLLVHRIHCALRARERAFIVCVRSIYFFPPPVRACAARFRTQGFGPPGSQPRVQKQKKGFGKPKQMAFAETPLDRNQAEAQRALEAAQRCAAVELCQHSLAPLFVQHAKISES